MKKYKYNLNSLTNQDEISYYLLGAFMTDGCVKVYDKRKLVTLTSKDQDWLSLIKDIICPELPITQYNNCGILNFYSTEMAEILISQGCTSQKSLTLQFPEIPQKYLPDFIRGLIDGDGSISQSSYTVKKTGKSYFHNVCYLCSSAPDFIKEFYKIVCNDFNCTLKIQSNVGRSVKYLHPHYRVTFTNSHCNKFLKKIYYPGHLLSMPRKRQMAKKLINNLIYSN